MQHTTESIEDYLASIYRLASQGEVRSKEISGYLGVRKSSVSEMLQRLGGLGLVSHGRYEGVKLTKKGEALAKKTLFKHRVIEVFLVKMLRQAKARVHGEAHKLEHAFSDESVLKIYAMLGKPKTGIHGEEIPSMAK